MGSAPRLSPAQSPGAARKLLDDDNGDGVDGLEERGTIGARSSLASPGTMEGLDELDDLGSIRQATQLARKPQRGGSPNGGPNGGSDSEKEDSESDDGEASPSPKLRLQKTVQKTSPALQKRAQENRLQDLKDLMRDALGSQDVEEIRSALLAFTRASLDTKPKVNAGLKARLVTRFFDMGGELDGELRELGDTDSEEDYSADEDREADSGEDSSEDHREAPDRPRSMAAALEEVKSDSVGAALMSLLTTVPLLQHLSEHLLHLK